MFRVVGKLYIVDNIIYETKIVEIDHVVCAHVPTTY